MEKIKLYAIKKQTPKEEDSEFDYFKEILLDMLREDYPQINLSQAEIDKRAAAATELLERDDLTTTQCIERAMDILEKDLAPSNRYVS